jgi:hypothetical protein
MVEQGMLTGYERKALIHASLRRTATSGEAREAVTATGSLAMWGPDTYPDDIDTSANAILVCRRRDPVERREVPCPRPTPPSAASAKSSAAWR